MKKFLKIDIWFDGNFVTSADEARADELFRRWVQLPALAVFVFDDGSREVIDLENL